MIHFIASNLTSSELKRFDRWAMSLEFPKVAPVYFNTWKHRLADLRLSDNEVEAFLKGMCAVRDDEGKANGFERSIMTALYQYYRQSDSIQNSASKAEKVANGIFLYRGWPTYEIHENNRLGSEL